MRRSPIHGVGSKPLNSRRISHAITGSPTKRRTGTLARRGEARPAANCLQLTPAHRLGLFAFPDDESELIRVATLSKEDFAFVCQHRGDHSRVRVATLMLYLVYPGHVLVFPLPFAMQTARGIGLAAAVD
ncbi:DUF4158 domain-containing protein [Burkholderia sp. SCN-KJ]|uniref:DUF4158 domain-containing protein n=1 Tax=Burkholderia sp. SCN-KJ TaxID=2969248 RepID=UPI00214FA4B1|nr:DUF4158 domain-containing protein [Burkholderia sp. SCN-KJ]MCR4470442.1 DUF4158 domain-containing protein [Burkholderia sp. SCN-KJ]